MISHFLFSHKVRQLRPKKISIKNMISLLKKDAITSKDIELNNMPFMHVDLQFTNGILFGAELFYFFKVSIPMPRLTHIGIQFNILPTAI